MLHSGKSRLGVLIIFFSLILTGCTSHPLIFPEPLKSGESFQGIILSAENVAPQYVYRRGLSDRMDLGLRIGFPPVHGSGIDWSLLMLAQDGRFHTLNLGYTYAEQQTWDLTYLNSKRRWGRKAVVKNGKRYLVKDKSKPNFSFFGLRYMYISNGIWKKSATRMGFLYGMNYSYRWGWEVGYFFETPLSLQTQTKPVTLPQSYEKYTGLTLRFWFAWKIVKKGS